VHQNALFSEAEFNDCLGKGLSDTTLLRAPREWFPGPRCGSRRAYCWWP